MYEFKCNESLASLISIGNEEPCYEDFNAHTLLDALQISLSNTDGCFVYFGSNTIYVGKMKENFFIYIQELKKDIRQLIERVFEL